MTTYNTGNPLGSTDPRDIYDNAQNFDVAINSNAKKWTDRLGVERYTWEGALENIAPLGHPWTEEEANAAIASGEIPNGAYYFVWSSDKNNIADVWRNVNGVATKTDKSYPSSEFVSELGDKVNYLSNQLRNVQNIKGVKDEMGREIIAGIASVNGKIPLYVNSNGDSFLSGLRIINLGGEPGLIFTDKYFRPYACSPGYSNPEGMPVIGVIPERKVNVIKFSGVMSVQAQGQSLSCGVTDQEHMRVLSTAQPYLNITFSGTIFSDTTATDTIAPLVESTKNESSEFPQSESYVSGFTNGLTKRLIDDRSSSASGLGTIFFGSSAGTPGLKLSEISKGTAAYAKTIDHTTNAKRLANAEGKTFSTLAVMFDQGQSDYRDNTSFNQWYTGMKAYLNDQWSDDKNITGQEHNKIYIADQISTHKAYARREPTIALAIRKLSHEGLMQIGFPGYVALYVDGVHMSPQEYLYCSKLAERSFFRALKNNVEGRENGITWLAITSEFVQGNIHELTCSVPTLPIRIKTDWIAEAENYGFDVINKVTLDIVEIIDSVVISATDRISVVLSRPLNPDETLTYGWGRPNDPQRNGRINGPRGNICDSSGDVPGESYTDSDGVLRPMDDYLEIWMSEL
ncbi:hypothetical protein [Serratia marcescens]|uniref:hypothetical protein n=1 Tax=Serratia marcescens TaxID=615 RepID=UPI002029E79C|nr:hypothetical protein [Serratia marcescens]